MRQKIFVLIMTLLFIISSILIIPEYLIVEATPGGGGEDGWENETSLDYDFMWDILGELSNVVRAAYEPGEIRKGRAMGTKGEYWTADTILRPRMENFGLENIDEIPLKTIPREGEPPFECAYKVRTIDFKLEVSEIRAMPL